MPVAKRPAPRTALGETFREALAAEDRLEEERKVRRAESFRSRFRRSPEGSLLAAWDMWLPGGGNLATLTLVVTISREPSIGGYCYRIATVPGERYEQRGGYASEGAALDALAVLFAEEKICL
jgi:hypothetical protein